MQWLNRVDDALDWVLGPSLGDNGDDNRDDQKRNPKAKVDDVGRTKSESVKRSPVVIHEDYTCPPTPLAAAVGEYLVLEESPYPSSTYSSNSNELTTVNNNASTPAMKRNASNDESKESFIHTEANNLQIDHVQSSRKPPPPPPPRLLFDSSNPLSQSEQNIQQKRQVSALPPPPQRNDPSSPRRVQNNPYNISRTTPRGPRAAPGVIRRRIRTPSISPPTSPPITPLLPPSPVGRTSASSDHDSNENLDLSSSHHLISQPILMPNVDTLDDDSISEIETDTVPIHSVNDALSLVPRLPLSPPLDDENNIELMHNNDNLDNADSIAVEEVESIGESLNKIDNVESAEIGKDPKEDNDWHLREWFSSSQQDQAVRNEQQNASSIDGDSSTSDSFHSHISNNSVTNEQKEDTEEYDLDNESNFERDDADFAIPFPSSQIIQDSRDWDPSLNCYGIVHVRLLRAQRLPCEEQATINATLSLPPWKGRIRVPSRVAKRGPIGAGTCLRWDRTTDEKQGDGGEEEVESPPSASEADDSCSFHMVHAYNNEDTPIPNISLELSIAKYGGVFEKFLCSISFPCHGIMQSSGSWSRGWYPASTIFGVDEVDEGADLDSLPFILIETCFEPRIDDATEALISEDDTLGSIPRDFEIRPNLKHSNLQHMPDSICSSADDESTSLMSGITSRNATSKPHLLRVRSFWTPAWCAVCSKVITSGWLQGSFECEACGIYCCRDCQLQVDVRIPCGSELSTIAVKKAQKYQLSVSQIMTTLAPQDDGKKQVDVKRPTDTTELQVGRSDEDSTDRIKGIGILNIRVLKACLFDKTYPSETEPASVFNLDSSNLRSGDHYVRVSWLGSRDSKRTKTVLQASKPVFDADNMVFDVPHYGMEYKVEVVDANTDRPVGSCLLSAQGILQWQRDDLLSSVDRLFLSFFHFRDYSEPRRLRLELRKGVKDGFGLNFYNSARVTESNENNASIHAGEISGWIDLDLHLQEDHKLFYSLEPRRCPAKTDEEFDVALIQLHIARISALVEDIQKLVSVYMYLVGWESDRVTATSLVSLLYLFYLFPFAHAITHCNSVFSTFR